MSLLATLVVCGCSTNQNAPSLVDIPERPQIKESAEVRNAQIEALSAEGDALKRKLRRIRREQNANSELYGDQ